MANLTIALDDDVLRRARVRAAQQGTSVNAVLRAELVRYANAGGGERAAEEFLAVAREQPGRGGLGPRSWSREALHLERLRER